MSTQFRNAIAELKNNNPGIQGLPKESDEDKDMSWEGKLPNGGDWKIIRNPDNANGERSYNIEAGV